MSTIEIAAAFIERLGDPTKYEFTGMVNDLGMPIGTCVCGHQIRYEYIIAKGSKHVAVGSECIHNFKHYNPKLYAKLLEAHEARLEKKKADEKKAREARRAKEVSKLEKEWNAGFAKIRKLFPEGLPWLPSDLYWEYQDLRKGPKQYKRSTTYIRWYKERMPRLKKLVKGMEARAKEFEAEKAKAEAESKAIPATERQIKYLKYLVAEHNETAPDWDKLSKDEASKMIGDLKYRVRV